MKKTFLIINLALIGGILNAQVPAQWRGIERDGIYAEANLLKSWPSEGPAMLWSVEGIGKGYSSAVSDGKNIYVTGIKNDTLEVLSCISPEGKMLWQVTIGAAFTKSFPGARSTPTVEGDRVYTISSLGVIGCYSASDGRKVWDVDGLKKFEGVYGTWGVSESPLVTGDKVIFTPAGPKTTMIALNKLTGETIWQSKTLNDTGSYVSPKLIHWGGKDIVVQLINSNLLGVDLANGNILWTFDYGVYMPEKSLKIWPGGPKTNAITPLFDKGYLYITEGYDHVGVMFQIPDPSSIQHPASGIQKSGSEVAKPVVLQPIWTDSTLDCHHGGVLLLNGCIYGANWKDNSRGNWCCLDWKTGKVNWETTWFTKGPIISDGTMLYCLDEKNGNLGLVRPDPAKFDLVSSFKLSLGKGPFWAHPSIYNGRLLVRHGDVLMVYNLSSEVAK